MADRSETVGEFRAALGLVRLAESSMTAVSYIFVGLFVRESVALVPWIVPSVMIGVPLGAMAIRRMSSETFRRICMSFDAWIVAFGLSKLLQSLDLMPGSTGYAIMVAVILLDGWLLYRFFGAERPIPATG